MDGKLIQKHFLVPEHVKLTEEEKGKFLGESQFSASQLPVIKSSDPAIQGLEAKAGDIIRIKRKSDTVGVSEFYRVVTGG